MMDAGPIVEAIERVFESAVIPGKSARNMVSANVVDGLFAIATAIEHLAQAVEQKKEGPARDLRPGFGGL